MQKSIERGDTREGSEMGYREVMDGEMDQTGDRAESSGRSLPRRRVRGKGQVTEIKQYGGF